MRTNKETAHAVYLAITEINKKLPKRKNTARRNVLIKEVCKNNGVNEKLIRKIGGYDTRQEKRPESL